MGYNRRAMKLSTMLSLILFFGLVLPSEGSFSRDVMRKRNPSTQQQFLNQELLVKAVPLDEYRKRINAKGLHLPKDGSRGLEDNSAYDYYYYNDDDQAQGAQGDDGDDYNGDDYNNNDDQAQAQNDDQAQEEEEVVYENEDDYYLNENNYVNYTGYSLKYAKCQPVRRFSQNAVEAGEYSPMVINDIVIMRLCPSMYCSDSRAYGCNEEYVEYAIELTDYIRIMMRYEMDKKEQLCDWCEACGSNQRRRRRRRDAQSYYYYYDEDGNLVQDENYVPDDDDDDAYQNLDCTNYEGYCMDVYGNLVCDDDDNNDDGDDDSYVMTPEGYLDIIACTQVNGGYFIRPRCDAYSESLTMGVYHDRFCSHYAGNEVSIDNFNLGINQSYFQEFGKDAGCQDCSESELPPYLNANYNLCNRLDIESARCTASTTSELFVNNYTDSSSDTEQCSFMDSVRFGTYDADGQLYSASTAGNRNRKVTDSQKWLLVLSLSLCGILAVYSCYLHHSITNLLIKSLSHTDLLPPSRFRRRVSSFNSQNENRRRGRGRRSRKPVNEDEDYESENFDPVKRTGVAMA